MICDECGKRFKKSEIEHLNGVNLNVCENCRNNFVCCENCGDYVHSDDILNHDNCYYCESCFDDNFTSCHNCGDTISRNYAYNYDGENYCEDCFNDGFNMCNGCNENFGNDDLTYNESDDCYYCEVCQPKASFKESDSFKANPFKRYVGVEIEVSNISIDDMKDALRLAGSESSVVYDSSVSDGCEIVTPAMNGDVLFNELKLIAKVCKSLDAEVNKDAGLHVHIDARDLKESELKKMYLGYSIFEPILFKMVSPSRRNNHYCQNINKEDILKLLEIDFEHFYYGDHGKNTNRYSSERYKSINFHSYFIRETLENRMHNGTMNFNKISNWILINLSIFEWLKNASVNRIYNLKSKIKTFNAIVGKKLGGYAQRRRHTFDGKNYKGIIQNIKNTVDRSQTTQYNCVQNMEVF